MPGDGETIYAALRGQIVGGELPAGTALRESALAERFGVSRTPIREALRRLEHDRLLERGARGLQVPAVDPREVAQVYDVRILLEGEAAAGAARAAGDGDVGVLGSLLARDRGLEQPEDATRMTTNLEFHAALWRAAHNAVLEDLLRRLTVHLISAPHSTLSVPGRWEEALDEHADLLAAIGAGDREGARRIAREHMATARRLRLALLAGA